MVGAQFLGGGVDHQLAVGEHVAPVGDGQGDVDVLLDEQHGAAALLGIAWTRPASDVRRSRGEPERQLVDQHQPWLARQRRSEREHLLLAARQQPCPAVARAAKAGKYV